MLESSAVRGGDTTTRSPRCFIFSLLLEAKNGFRRAFKGLDMIDTAKGIRMALRASMSVLEGFYRGSGSKN
jgi:hypothetical protein